MRASLPGCRRRSSCTSGRGPPGSSRSRPMAVGRHTGLQAAANPGRGHDAAGSRLSARRPVEAVVAGARVAAPTVFDSRGCRARSAMPGADRRGRGRQVGAGVRQAPAGGPQRLAELGARCNVGSGESRPERALRRGERWQLRSARLASRTSGDVEGVAQILGRAQRPWRWRPSPVGSRFSSYRLCRDAVTLPLPSMNQGASPRR